jgi:hypothetical protein
MGVLSMVTRIKEHKPGHKTYLSIKGTFRDAFIAKTKKVLEREHP